MPQSIEIFASTAGLQIAADTNVAIRDETTGNNASVLQGQACFRISVYKGSGTLSAGCRIQVGTADEPSCFISMADNISTDDLNSRNIVTKHISIARGLVSAAELRLRLDNPLNEGSIFFLIKSLTGDY